MIIIALELMQNENWKRKVEEHTAYNMLQRGRELLSEGNPAQAALVLEKARAAAPRKGSILEVLGRSYFACGRYSESASRFEEAVEVDPTNHYAHYCLGICYVNLRRKADAAGHFKLAWFLKPDEKYRSHASRFGAT